MNTIRNSMHAWSHLAGAGRLLWIPALVMIAALLSFYVQLLHQSLARGEALREEQRTGVSAARPEPTGATRDGRSVAAQSLSVTARR